jgi:membrane-anchored mycosin MYCP
MARWSGTSFAAATVSGAIASRTEPGRRTAHEALDELRSGAYGSGTGIAGYPGR